MKRFVAFLLVVLAVFSLSGCGEEKLKVYNWAEVIDEDMIDRFTEETGIEVIYEKFDSNEDMFVKVNTDRPTYDVVFPSDYTVLRMKQKDLLAELDYSNIPNAANIDPKYLKDPVVDPDNTYSLPYVVGTLGILYNKTMVEEPVDSFEILWDEKYAGKIFIWNSERDAIGMALKVLGYSMNSKDPAELEEAKQKLIEQKPLVQAYISDEIKDKMIAGEGALALMYSGDAMSAMMENEDLVYVVPKEGSNKWADNMVVLKSSTMKKEAEMFINFLCREEVAAANMNLTGYTSPVTGAKDLIDPELQESEVMFPSQETLDTCEAFDYDEEATKMYARIWTEVLAY